MAKPLYIVVTPFFPTPTSWRGPFCYDFVRALKNTNKYDVRVFVPGDGRDYDYHDVHVYTFKYKEFPCGIFPWFLEGKNQRSFLKKLRDVGISASDVDICHGHTKEFAIYPLAIKRINPGCLTLLHHHISAPLKLYAGRFGAIKGYTDLLYLWVRRVCDAIDCHVPCSKQVAETYDKLIAIKGSEFYLKDLRSCTLLGRLLPALKQPKQIMFYNGYDDSIFYPDRVTHSGFVIGCVGNFNDQKRQMTILRAFKELARWHPQETTDWKIRFVGSGPLLASARQFVEENKMSGQVSFETEVDHTELPKFYNSIDLFVLPSAYEGFCCVYMEAFGCGTPFIATRGVSTEEVVSEESKESFLVALDNSTQLADKIWGFYLKHPTLNLTQSMRYADLMDSFVNKIDNMRNS